MSVRTRFAPSPTGYLHIGGVRTALYSYLFARRHGGQFVLRVEDTDRERSTAESVQAILDGMAWVGLEHDEGPFFQTERFGRYAEVIDTMLAQGSAYRCYCTREELAEVRAQQESRKEKPRYNGCCRARTGPREGVDPVVRFRSPDDGAVVIDDLVKGRVVFQNAELDDLIIARSDGTPTYNFTVVVDDIDMKISHVIRGDDHLNNTPRQINIMEALGWTPPQFAHLPMILGADGGRLSKRHGAVSVLQYKEDGFVPQALLNYLVRLGWSHGDQEIFSRDEMVALFDLEHVNGSPSIFDTEKLTWLNQHYIKTADVAMLQDDLAGHYRALDIDVQAGPGLADVIELYRDRAKTLLEMAQSSRYLFAEPDAYDEKAVKKFFKASATPVLQWMSEKLGALSSWDEASIDELVQHCMVENDVKMGAVAQPLRVAVTGSSMSPSIGATLGVLGRSRTLGRLDRALEFLRQRHAADS